MATTLQAEAQQPEARERVSAEEYLRHEREGDQLHKSEYRNGRIVPMSGASRYHVRIVTNIVFELESQLRDGTCFVFSTDLRVRVEDPTGLESDLYTYPDVGVVCDEPEYLDDHFDTLLNPALLVEVLSQSTKGYDRGEKFARYRALGSLRDYVLIDPQRVHAEHFAKQGDGRWVLTETGDADATLALDSVDAELTLAEAYHKVALKA